jgi:hypothetical protein
VALLIACARAGVGVTMITSGATRSQRFGEPRSHSALPSRAIDRRAR